MLITSLSSRRNPDVVKVVTKPPIDISIQLIDNTLSIALKYIVNVKGLFTYLETSFYPPSLSVIFYIMFQSYLFWVFCFTKSTNWQSVACSSSSVATSDTSYWKFKTIASEKETICICNCFKIFITKMDVQKTPSYLCNIKTTGLMSGPKEC